MSTGTPPINFITQGHEAEYYTVRTAATSIERLYPDATYYIYDGGFNYDTRAELEEFEHTVLVDWQDEATFDSEFSTLTNALADIESKIENNMYLNHIIRGLLRYEYRHQELIDTERWDFFMRQKPRTILDLTDRVEGNVVWLDADVVPINRMDEVLNCKFDIAATARTLFEERYHEMPPLNAGVLLFDTSAENIRQFVERWLETIERMELTKHREQTAVTELFRQSNPQIFERYYNTGVLEIGSTELRTQILPCRKYNYYRFRDGIDPVVNKILHFKSSESSAQLDINQQLIEDIRKNNLSNWYRDNLKTR